MRKNLNPYQFCTFWALLCFGIILQAAPPPLPGGLAPETEKPDLSEGLSSPGLPAGLVSPSTEETFFTDETEPFLSISGFWDIRGGFRLQSDAHEHQTSLGETRLQLEFQKEIGPVTANLTTDFLFDSEAPTRRINLDKGIGWLDLREANLAFSPFSFVDIKAGRQILTWGTGDLIFINDLFPKDWQAFFIGRDVEYLKAPSDAIKASFFSDWVNLDVVYTPRFDADRSLTGERISYYNPATGKLDGRNAIIQSDRPDSDEWELRLYRTIGFNELALYAYNGFWKSPAGINPITGKAIHPDLRTIGFSLRRPFLQGIGNVEAGYYHSPDSNEGDNPFAQNSEFRFLAGYEQEIFKDFSISLQYYLELMQDYSAYRRNLPPSIPRRDQDRHVLTMRLTLLTMNQNLIWSLFSFYSPSDQDAYLRPNVNYKVTDQWSAEIGGNFFLGERSHTFFGQFRNNNNAYMAFRYGF